MNLRTGLHPVTGAMLILAWNTLAADVPMRDRLVQVAEDTRRLQAAAQPSAHANYVQPIRLDTPQAPADRRFPTADQAVQFARLRPWTRQYALRCALPRNREAAADPLPDWPTPAEAPALRQLLTDQEPAVRCLAIEALATLHEPADVKRIAALLADEAEGLPALGWNHYVVSMVIHEQSSSNEVDLLRTWYSRKVSTYAKAALKLMTGEQFEPARFGSWWERNQGGRACLWYWQERLYRDLAAAAAKPVPAFAANSNREPTNDWQQKYQAEMTLRRQAVIDAVAAELLRQPPEVEAKVWLLAWNQYTSALGVNLDDPLMGPCKTLRLPPDRLLDLLDHQDLWQDVAWDATHYNALVRQLANSAENLFRPIHLPRLQAVRERERGKLSWASQSALCIAVSRLLPPADNAHLDDPQTRDGCLREAIRQSTDVIVRGTVARELVRVAVTQNWPFLEAQCFAEQKSDITPDLRMAVVQELGAPPLTPEKRAALARLLLDKRYAPLWTRPLGQMGDDLHRQFAIWSVNAHAGKEILTVSDEQNLREPRTAQAALAKVLKTVAEVLENRPN